MNDIINAIFSLKNNINTITLFKKRNEIAIDKTELKRKAMMAISGTRKFLLVVSCKEDPIYYRFIISSHPRDGYNYDWCDGHLCLNFGE